MRVRYSLIIALDIPQNVFRYFPFIFHDIPENAFSIFFEFSAAPVRVAVEVLVQTRA